MFTFQLIEFEFEKKTRLVSNLAMIRLFAKFANIWNSIIHDYSRVVELWLHAINLISTIHEFSKLDYSLIVEYYRFD